MKSTHATLIALLMLTGCLSPAVKTSAIQDTLTTVMARSDVYVSTDSSLTAEQRVLVLAQSAQLRNMLTWTEVSRAEFAVMVLPLLDRHDAYIQSDSTLSVLERRIFLRSSETLRQVATASAVAGVT